MADWLPISEAPKDGRPVWARGWDWGKPGTTRHYGWVFWTDDGWAWAGPGANIATFLTDYLPTQESSHERG